MDRARQRKRVRRFLYVSFTSVMVTVGAAVVVTLYNMDALLRWEFMSRICSEDKTERRQGISYLVRHSDNPKVIDHARWMLDGADEPCFEALVGGLSQAGLWGPRFGDAWVRYLADRIDEVTPKQRQWIAVELGELRWQRRPGHESPRIGSAVETLLKSEDADVRLNALSAAACLSGENRLRLLRHAADDPNPAVAKHAWIMLTLLGEAKGGSRPDSVPAGIEGPPPTGPPADAQRSLKRLAELERKPTASEPLSVDEDQPPLVLLHAVRVSTESEPNDLLPVLEQKQAPLRDQAVLAAVERFSEQQCVALAKKLIAAFSDERRMAGAMLGGMVEPDRRLRELLHLRAEKLHDWMVQQHYNLALAMQGEPPEGFEPTVLLARDQFPRTSLIMGLTHMGRLDGVNWLLAPFGEPPVSLAAALDRLRYARVLRRYIPQLPEFWYWADEAVQRYQAEVWRDWYLLFRPQLRFDEKGRVYRVTEGASDAG